MRYLDATDRLWSMCGERFPMAEETMTILSIAPFSMTLVSPVTTGTLAIFE